MINHFITKSMFKCVALVTSVAVLSMSGIGTNSKVWAETLEEREARLKKEAPIVELERKIEEDRQAAAEARQATAAAFPDIDPSQAPSGSITANEVEFESNLLAYRALESVASDIQKEITSQLGSNLALIIFDTNKVASVALDKLSERSFSNRVVAIQRDYKALNIIKTGIPFELFELSAATGFLFDILPFFRVDRTFEGFDIQIADRSFVGQLASKFREAGQSNVSVYYPSEYPLISNDSVNSIVSDISTLQQLQRQAKSRLPKLSDPERVKLEAVNQSVDALVSDLKTVNEKTGRTLFEDVARSRTLKKIADSGKRIYNLSIKVVAGGTNRTSRSFLSNRLRHSGGTIVEYIIYDSDLASIILSNTHDAYTGFTKVPSAK